MNPRSEPLLWLQLMAIAAIPLELLAMLLVLAGADPGPVPALERLLAWGLGAFGPAVLLLRRPADIGSLLLVQVPAAGRSALQRRLSGLKNPPLLSVLLLLGVAGLLPLLWRLDAIAALATPFSPLSEANRLVTLLLAMPLLAVLVWQWQQVLQALWLLSRSSAQVEAAKPLSVDELNLSRLSLGLPLLLLQPLQPQQAPAVRPATAGVGAAARAGNAAAATAGSTEQTAGSEATAGPPPSSSNVTAPATAAEAPETPPETEPAVTETGAPPAQAPEPAPTPGLESDTLEPSMTPEPSMDETAAAINPEGRASEATATAATAAPATEPQSEPERLPEPDAALRAAEPAPASDEEDASGTGVDVAGVNGPGTVAVEPEQQAEEQQGSDLDQQIL